MAIFNRHKPAVPALYAQLILQQLKDRGLDPGAVESRLDFRIPKGKVLGLISRVSIAQQEALARTVHQFLREHGEDPSGLGLALGLKLTPTSHGTFGFAILSQPNAWRLVKLFLKFCPIIMPGVRIGLTDEDGVGVLDIKEEFQLADDLRGSFYDFVLSGIWRSFSILLPAASARTEIWFEGPEPTYFSAYQSRLPTCRFNMGVNQIRCPLRYFDVALPVGDAMTALSLERQLLEEIQLSGHDADTDIAEQVRHALTKGEGQQLDLDQVSRILCMAPSTLRRKLQGAGTNFQRLREEVLCDEAKRLLKCNEVPIKQVAVRLGYADVAGFSHAFRKWTGVTPATYRKQVVDRA